MVNFFEIVNIPNFLKETLI